MSVFVICSLLLFFLYPIYLKGNVESHLWMFIYNILLVFLVESCVCFTGTLQGTKRNRHVGFIPKNNNIIYNTCITIRYDIYIYIYYMLQAWYKSCYEGEKSCLGSSIFSVEINTSHDFIKHWQNTILEHNLLVQVIFTSTLLNSSLQLSNTVVVAYSDHVRSSEFWSL